MMLTPPAPCWPRVFCLSVQRSSRARKVRNLDDSNSLAAKGAPRSMSPTPPPISGEEGFELEQQHQHGHALPKRMRLDAGSQHMPGPGSPAAPSRQQQHQQLGTSSPEAEMPPALDLWVCSPPREPTEEEQLPRRRRIPRKVGARASARKRMHRPTFKRGKPQRAPAA